MLTAWNVKENDWLALPDCDQLDWVREQTREGGFICRTCEQLLWLRAGVVRRPHFAHRKLSDCPASRVSENVLRARERLYRFFRDRIRSGKLNATVQLEVR